MANIIVIIVLSSILFNICVYHHFRHFHHFPRWWWWRLQNTTMWSPVIIPMTRGYYISYHHRHDYHHCHHRHHRHHRHYRKSASSSTSSSEIIANQSPFTSLEKITHNDEKHHKFYFQMAHTIFDSQLTRIFQFQKYSNTTQPKKFQMPHILCDQLWLTARGRVWGEFQKGENGK